MSLGVALANVFPCSSLKMPALKKKYILYLEHNEQNRVHLKTSATEAIDFRACGLKKKSMSTSHAPSKFQPL